MPINYDWMANYVDETEYCDPIEDYSSALYAETEEFYLPGEVPLRSDSDMEN